MSALDLFDVVRPLPCLSLWEPWASLLLAGYKHHETRHWPTKVRGRIALHAAKKVDVAGAPHELCEFAFGPGWAKTRPVGCVVGVAELTACRRTEVFYDPRARALIDTPFASDELAGNFAPGRFAFRMLAEPLPTTGRQGFFRWAPPADLAARLLPPVDQIGAAKRWDVWAIVRPK
jgi:hypothetical protein